MPRYCAVKTCRNRGGAAPRQDNKRISFYPFPLQDKSRLQKWVDNMKRGEWTPSRHQYLCSEHFTEDCFDIRWGIRYLKNTAIPTRFPPHPSTEDDGEKKNSSPKTFTTDPAGCDPPLSKRPLILSKTSKKEYSSLTNAVNHTELLSEPPLVLDTGLSSHLNLSEIWTTACRLPDDYSDEPTASPGTEPHPEQQADSTVTVLCCESLGACSEGEENMDSAAHQAFSFVPVEIVEEEPSSCFSERRVSREGEDISVWEHSYCRLDTDKDQLWRKILSLHAKILELGGREESTVAKIRALESEVALLKRDGAVFKERQKMFEDFISSTLL